MRILRLNGSRPQKTLLLTFASVALYAGTIRPDAYGYSATNGLVNWTDISSTGTACLAPGIDDSSVAACIGFNFNFYGTDYTSLFVSTNGLITFTGGNTDFSNDDLTLTDQGQATIAPYWDDLTTGNIYALTLRRW